MKKKRYILEGEWSGYRSSQQRVVHRTIISEKCAKEINEKLNCIRYTDGTSLYLSTRLCKPREKVDIINGYNLLIDKCLLHGVSSVDQLPKSKNVS